MTRDWRRLAPVSVLAVLCLALVTCQKKRGAAVRMRRVIAPVLHQVEGGLESPRELDPSFPPGLGVHTIYLDAGHGAAKNPGNTSCFCVEEQEFSRYLAIDVADYLEHTGRFRVELSRVGTELVSYGDRVAAARSVGAEAFVSIHSDIRGPGKSWSPAPGETCLKNVESPGYVVLYSDEGAPALVESRRALALGISARMKEEGFLHYTSTYEGLYALDTDDPSVLIDRHAEEKRIFILRRTSMPAVIVETHHALDPREATLWEKPETRRAFAAALAQALADVLPGNASSG